MEVGGCYGRGDGGGGDKVEERGWIYPETHVRYIIQHSDYYTTPVSVLYSEIFGWQVWPPITSAEPLGKRRSLFVLILSYL